MAVIAAMVFKIDGKPPGRTPSTIRVTEELAARATVRQNATWQTDLLPSPHQVCPTETVWSRPATALDLYGNLVEVLPAFRQNDVLVEQIFQEKFCASTTTHKEVRPVLGPSANQGNGFLPEQCFGIDQKLFEGVCVTQPSFVYANVKNQRGEVGWNVIRIRGGCQCALLERPHADKRIRSYAAKRSN
jgi:Nerve growth factor family